jgi:type III restriction enzyme
MAQSFYEQPILNSPYEPPSRHHPLDRDGQPLDDPPVEGRRRSEFITPVPRPRKKRKAEQGALDLDARADEAEEQKYNPTPVINEIRSHVASWRALPNAGDWGVTPTTARLLEHWRHHEFAGVTPFFCQVEAVETLIWLTEVARREKRYAKFWEHIQGANLEANPELLRIAMKMATGTGKTTVMAMLIAWQTLNAVRQPTSNLFTRGFLIIAPGITIKDRLRVLQPGDSENYFKDRELIPADMMGDIGKAKIVITNFHAFKRREELELSKVGRSLLQGRGEPPDTIESEGKMLDRVCGGLLGLKDKNILVINDEAHHCYRHKVRDDAEVDTEEDLTGEEKDEAKKNNEAARIWINGIEALNRKKGVRVYDLSATPFFLRGSGYAEGTLFPWTVSDFSLMDAIESGIVKLPRVPVADNLPGAPEPLYRNLWEHIGKKMPKKGRAKSGQLDPLSLQPALQTALFALYGHYEKTYELWQRAGIETPPVFIVVCSNTAASQLVYEWIAGWDREEDGERKNIHQGHLGLFRNYDQYGGRLARPMTLLIDSEQLESGEALEGNFREMAADEIERFRYEKSVREGSAAAEKITDAELLREAMNTVGKKGRLGEQIRCVVSVSMLTEGWDTNTVTHILGVRAFGTQLLCEQVVGRALRRQSYELNEHGLFDVEYADIMGIPFDFASKPVVVVPKPPQPTTRVQAVKERAELEIVFPRVEGYRVEMPDERIVARFNDDSRLILNPLLVGPCKVLMEGIVGEGVELNMETFDSIRPSTITFHLAKHLMFTRFRDHGEEPPLHLFGQIQRVARQWLEGGYLVCQGGTKPGQILYREIVEEAAQRIYLACQREENGNRRIKAILDAYNPKGSTKHVNFNTSKNLYRTAPNKCHVNYVVTDSDWEAELARVLESHPKVRSYVKNQGLQFEVPYRMGSVPRKYIPDFIVQVDDGREDLLNLVLETKGYRKGDAQLKAETMKTLWVPGVNNLGTFGRWAFEEFTDVFEIEYAFGKLMERTDTLEKI